MGVRLAGKEYDLRFSDASLMKNIVKLCLAVYNITYRKQLQIDRGHSLWEFI